MPVLRRKYTGKVEQLFFVFETSDYLVLFVTSLNEQQWEDIKEIYSRSASAQTFLSDYNPEDVGAVFLPHYSSSVWTIPPPEEKDLEKELNDNSTCKHTRYNRSIRFL